MTSKPKPKRATCDGALLVKSIHGIALYTERDGEKIYEHRCDRCGRTTGLPVIGGACQHPAATAKAPKIEGAAAIVARLNPDKRAADHNVIALLLRCADNEPRWDDDTETDNVRIDALALARRDGLIKPRSVKLSALGCEVAEMLRPKPWTANPTNVQFYRDTFMGELFGPDGEREAEFNDVADAQRAAEMFTESARRAAKTYKTVAG